eukprot:SAG11_NODE_2276_length_3583_cov_2.156429_5_plen_104_part_00
MHVGLFFTFSSSLHAWIAISDLPFDSHRRYRIDALMNTRLNSRFGVRAFPTLALLENGSLRAQLHERHLDSLIQDLANRTNFRPCAPAKAVLGASQPHSPWIH